MKIFNLIVAICFAANVFAQVPTDGLVAYYPFTNSISDSSGHFYTGYDNFITFSADRFGHENSACLFNGNNSYIDLSSYTGTFNFQQPASFSFWVKTETDTSQIIFSLTDNTTLLDNAQLISIGNFTTGTLTDEIIGISHIISENVNHYITGFVTENRDTLIDNEWHHIAMVFDGLLTKIYLDSYALTLSTNWGTNNGFYGGLNNVASVLIGARNASSLGSFFNGSLDDLRIYNVALDSLQVLSLFLEADHSVIKETNLEQNISVFPNPTNTDFIVSLGNEVNGKDYKLQIFNSYCQEVYSTKFSGNFFRVNKHCIGESGIYLINVLDYNDFTVKTCKIMIE